MTLFYLALAALIAALLLAGRIGARLAGAAAGIALFFNVWSIWLANADGTFAGGGWRVWTLNAMMVLGGIGVALLLASLFRRNPPGPRYPAPARLAHWSSAVLMLAALPLGLFVAVLPETRADRADFLAAHLAAGLFILALLPLRPLLRRHTPPAAAPARIAQIALYLAMAGGGVTGLALAAALDVPVLGLPLPALLPGDPARSLHLAAAALFAAAFAAHLAGALIGHFARRETLRML